MAPSLLVVELCAAEFVVKAAQTGWLLFGGAHGHRRAPSWHGCSGSEVFPVAVGRLKQPSISESASKVTMTETWFALTNGLAPTECSGSVVVLVQTWTKANLTVRGRTRVFSGDS